MEEKTNILVVDDEKNIRLTMSQAIESPEVSVQTAVNGEEALQKLGDASFKLVFLDLKMPGMDGVAVMRRIKETWPKIRVIIITAHGTIESAVEAMKLGAVDFIQKPFNPQKIREVTAQVLAREALNPQTTSDYHSLIELAKRYITDRAFAVARETIRRAIAVDPGQPSAFNLLGALLEIKGDGLEAQKFYRAALDIDPTYKPAWMNLDRITSWYKFGPIDIGEEAKSSSIQNKKSQENPDEK